jgi:hypothetical protein
MVTTSIIVFILGFLFCLIIAVGALSIFFTILEHITDGRDTKEERDQFYH